MIKWEKITHSGKHHAILFIDTVFQGYQSGYISRFFNIKFNPRHYRQFDGARWWNSNDVKAYISFLKKKEERYPGFLFRKAFEYEELNQDFWHWGKQYKNYDFSKLNNSQLGSIFSKFVKQISKIHALVYTPIFLDRFYTDKITRIIAKHEKNFAKQQKYLDAIFTVEWGLESHLEKVSLIKLAEKIWKQGKVTKAIENDIASHIKKFEHLSLSVFYKHPFNRRTIISSVKNILENGLKAEKARLKALRKNSDRITQIGKLLKLKREEILKIKTLRKWTFIANNDDHYVMGTIHFLWGLWQEIAKRFGVTFKLFIEMRVKEIQDGLKAGQISDELKKELLSRVKLSVMVWDEMGTRILVGAELIKYTRKEKRQEQFNKRINKIYGQSASAGRASGRTRILKDLRDISKVKKGDILVAIYTYPAIVVAMQNASAIVTDQGGLLSHAAIVSRELGKPCIVGTKIATKVLKDGDLVEVDANKGVVKIIKK